MKRQGKARESSSGASSGAAGGLVEPRREPARAPAGAPEGDARPQPFSSSEQMAETDPALLKLAERAFQGVSNTLPLNGRELGPFSYFLAGFTAGLQAAEELD